MGNGMHVGGYGVYDALLSQVCLMDGIYVLHANEEPPRWQRIEAKGLRRGGVPVSPLSPLCVSLPARY